ncbi:MAG: glycosyltransferase family 1 protein [Odoribacter sp.]
MRIGFDAKRLYNNFTGLGNYSRTLVRDLELFYPDDEYFLYTPSVHHCPTIDLFDNVPGHTTFVSPAMVKAYWRGCSIKKNLYQDQIDVFHGLSHEIPLNIHKTNVRSVVTIHDIIYKTYPDMFSAIDRCIYDFKFRYSCKYADKVVAISESTKRDIIRYFGTPEDKIEVVYQAINDTFYQMQSEEEMEQRLKPYHLPCDYMLYVGSINSRKNLLSVVKALRHLPSDLLVPLVVIGKGGAYKKEVQLYAERNQLSNRLIWLDSVNENRTLQAFYQRASIFIFPSIYEGFGLPVAEALLCKTPVITSNVSSLPEAGGDFSCYVAPMDDVAMAECMVEILSNPQKQEEMREEGYVFAHRQFDPHRLTSQMHHIYQELYSK